MNADFPKINLDRFWVLCFTRYSNTFKKGEKYNV